MLSGSAILRLLLLLVVAAGIAGAIQRVWLNGPVPAAIAPPVEGTDPDPPEAPPGAPPAEPIPEGTSEKNEAIAAPPLPRTIPTSPSPQPAPPPPAPAPPMAQTAPPPVPPSSPDPVAEAEENAPPAAVNLVDLNTGTLAELNGLKGGGAIGRTIIQHRPYGTVEQLLSKRVLNRATYQRIKDQVIVR